MRFPGFIGPSYTLRSVNVECQRCVNLYAEIDEAQTEKDGGVAALIGTPGLELLNTIGSGPFRGMYRATNNVIYVVSGGTLYTLDSSFNATTIGALLSNSGNVSMADNGISLFLVDGAHGYYSTLGTTSLTQTTDANWQGSNLVVCADGVFVFAKPDSFKFYTSQAGSVVINPLSSSSNNTLQKIIGIVWQNRNLWIINEQTTEIWFDAQANNGGTTGNQFQIVQGGYVQAGAVSPFSIAQVANSIFCLGQDQNGYGIVFKSNGYNFERVSTHAVELALQKAGDLSKATAWSYEEEGHTFYLLNVPGLESTWAFDQATNLWHERAYLNDGVLERHRGQVHVFAFNKNLVGDYRNGSLYSLDSDVYSDFGTPLVAERASPHVSDDMNRVFHHKFQLDFQPGVGLSVGQGSDPQVMLQYSDDGGHNWSSELWVSLGKIGKTFDRAIWYKLGQSRTRVYKIRITDPVKRILIGATLELSEGSS